MIFINIRFMLIFFSFNVSYYRIRYFLHISEIYNFVILSYILYIICCIFLIENL